jgi:hypothetical protein
MSMVRINENLIINESHIVKAEFSKSDDDQILRLLFVGRTAQPDEALCEFVLKGRDAWALWEYLVNKAERC